MQAAAPTTNERDPGVSSQPRSPKRIVTAIYDDVRAFKRQITGGCPNEVIELERLLNGGLELVDNAGIARPELAEAAPTIENGNWRIAPDGRMEARYTLKPGQRWHDGSPFTSADLVFTHEVWADCEQPIFRDVQLEAVDRVEAPDPLSVIVYWKRASIYADTLFSLYQANPMLRHLIEAPFLANQAGLVDLPYWPDARRSRLPVRRGQHREI
jgi:ABC-type transport system substrate-binding protein